MLDNQTVMLGRGGCGMGRSVYGSLDLLKMDSQILKIFFLRAINFFLVLRLPFDQGLIITSGPTLLINSLIEFIPI